MTVRPGLERFGRRLLTWGLAAWVLVLLGALAHIAFRPFMPEIGPFERTGAPLNGLLAILAVLIGLGAALRVVGKQRLEG